jgi:hypothetical protein
MLVLDSISSMRSLHHATRFGADTGAPKGRKMPKAGPYHIELADDERGILKKRSRTRTALYLGVVRATIVLSASQGLADKEIAARLPNPVRRRSQSGASGFTSRA